MRFTFVESWRHIWSVEMICRVMRVSPRGYRSWRSRPISRRVGRLMKINGIKPVRTQAQGNDRSNHRLGVAANWLDGDCAADMPNRKWAGDITYIRTSEGWLDLAVILGPA